MEDKETWVNEQVIMYEMIHRGYQEEEVSDTKSIMIKSIQTLAFNDSPEGEDSFENGENFFANNG